MQTLFFAPGDFDPKILTFATNTGEPVAIGEILTIGGADYATNELKAPVLIITGEYDVPYCGGDCYAAPTGYTSIPETSKINFPNASPFMVDIVKGAGHGLNLQYTHSQVSTILAGRHLARYTVFRIIPDSLLQTSANHCPAVQTYAAILDFFAQNGPTSNGTVKSRDGGSDNKRNPGGMGGRGGKGGMRGHYGKREDDLTSGHTVMQIVDRQSLTAKHMSRTLTWLTRTNPGPGSPVEKRDRQRSCMWSRPVCHAASAYAATIPNMKTRKRGVTQSLAHTSQPVTNRISCINSNPMMSNLLLLASLATVRQKDQ